MATKTKAEIEAETKAAEANVDNEEAERVALLVPTTIYSQASNDCVIPRYKETNGNQQANVIEKAIFTKHTQHLSLIHISEPTRPY